MQSHAERETDAPHHRAVAIVGVGAILPDAPNAPTFWQNVCNKRYSIIEVPPERWSIADYYDPDPAAPDKTYSKIGSWVRGFQFDWQKFRIPPKVAAAMDEGQQWAVTIAAEALADYGYPERPLDTERTGVVFGNAMGGEMHYRTTLRISFPEFANALEDTEFANLPEHVRRTILEQWRDRVGELYPPVTEDTMPGELANILAGRVANVLNLRGPNFVADAACASSFAAINAAIEMLVEHRADAFIAGGVDRNMGAGAFVKFCKIGALSATGSRPFAEGADGFVMGEGSASFLLKRLADAERDGDRIYAVIRGIGASSDGKGKGITAPNPVGQRLSISRAWENAGLDPATASLVEAHGTSTRVGDMAEAESLVSVFRSAPRGSIALGSVKSNIGHLKAGAGAAGLLKAIYALHHKLLPPTLNIERPNPNIDFATTPFHLNTDLRKWPQTNGAPRRAGVSAYGFGGTNFHAVLEEYVPGMIRTTAKTFAAQEIPLSSSAGGYPSSVSTGAAVSAQPATARQPLRHILALGAESTAALHDKLGRLMAQVESAPLPARELPSQADLLAPERLIIDFNSREELIERMGQARRAFDQDNARAWRSLQSRGVFRGSGPRPGKIAFLFPGQGSQYVNMGRDLVQADAIAGAVFAQADRTMAPLLGGSPLDALTSYFFVDANDEQAVKVAEQSLMQTAITQPAVLAMDTALFNLLNEYGFYPDMAMGHSLGEYGALIAAGVLSFPDALEISALRGHEMARSSNGDQGWMAAVFAPLAVVEETLAHIDGYVVAANINSYSQCVIGGASDAVAQAMRIFSEAGFRAIRIPVSHAFHTRLVAHAAKPLRQALDRYEISPPVLPLISNVTGEFYPTTPEEIRALLELQIASPVQWVKGMETLYEAGVRTFVEVGPKKALKGFVDDVLGERADVISLFTNHPKTGEVQTFNHALCGLYAAGYGAVQASDRPIAVTQSVSSHSPASSATVLTTTQEGVLMPEPSGRAQPAVPAEAVNSALLQALQRLAQSGPAPTPTAYDRNIAPAGSVVITGAGLGLPGPDKPVMDPANALRILRGEQFIDLIPERFRQRIAGKRITRLVKGEDGSGHFETIDDPSGVIKLAGRAGYFDLTAEYGVPEKLVEALDITTQLAMAAGLDALREAGIPLVQTYKLTSKGTYLPEKWVLPEPLRDETGVIFASLFPSADRLAQEFQRYFAWEARNEQLAMLEDLRQYASDPAAAAEIGRRAAALRELIAAEPYEFDRRFLFRVMGMGHSQFAEYIGARGPNTQVNAACASTTQAVALAEDWIRSGRCRRVIVIGGDNVTSDNLLEWIGTGFLAMGATATDDRVDAVALPFDRRRHGTVLGMGACALVLESEDAVAERGMRGVAELLSSETANSAYHGTRLEPEHISQVMDRLLTSAERRFGVNRFSMAAQTVFVSHETYTPARGGSASAEVSALRHTFGHAANDLIVANTKGFTGHPMGVGIEDVIAVKILEYGIVPPVPNFKEVDPELGALNFSRGGRYPVQYALHLAAGFGSQIAMTLLRRIPGSLDRVQDRSRYRRWLADVSGYDAAETEVVQRVLRIKAQGAATRPPVPSSWQMGTGPVCRATSPGEHAASDHRPMPMAGVAQQLALHGSPVPPAAPARPASPALDAPPAFAAHQPAPEPERIVQRPAPEPQESQTARRELPSNGPAPIRAGEAAPIPTSGNVQIEQPEPAAPAAGNLKSAIENLQSQVAEQVMALVAAKTGYPQDMLDLDLDLEADLGIDTVKQAETFAAIRETFAIPLHEGLNLRDYPTLAAVIGFVHTMRPDLAQPASPHTAPSQPAAENLKSAIENLQSQVEDRVLAIVAAKTGYPQDMLDLDLDLEADLGIDTVKQAETFAAIRETFAIPLHEGLNLRDYPTLAAVIGFVHTMRPDLAQPEAPQTASSQPAAGNLKSAIENLKSQVEDRVLAIVAAKTGYPQDMLDLDLDLEADLGIDTVKQAETFAAIRETFAIPLHEGLNLRDYPTLAAVIGFVHTMRPDLAQPASPHTAPSQPAAENLKSAIENLQSQVEDRVLAIVAAKTGYPQDMLDLDLDLEADLGIDTVKQAETFAAIRETFAIPLHEGLNLRDYPTLAAVIGFVHTMRPDLAQPEAPQTASSQPAAGNLKSKIENLESQVLGTLEDADRMPRRIPVPSLRPPLDLCKPTGVKLDEHSRVVVMLDRSGVGKALVSRLQKLGVTPLVIQEPPSADELQATLKAWLAEGPIQGVYWLPALDVEPSLADMDLAAFRESNRVRVKNLYTAMRALYDAIAAPGTFLISATRLGGLHGYGPAPAAAPLGGAVTGFTKAYHIEQRLRGEGGASWAPLVKAVDFEVSRKTAEPADQLIAETLYDPGIVEVGYYDGLRYTVTLADKPARDGGPGMTLDPQTVFVVTGAAGGITSAIVADLAVASRGIFYLLDLVEAPPADDPHVQLLRSDVEALKQQLIDEARNVGERPTPAAINKRIAEIERREAALRSIEAVTAAGGTAYYRSVNLLDGAAVTAVVDEIRQRHGRIDVLLHAGGLLIDRTLPDKEPQQFDLVFDVKADGFFSLLKAAHGMPIGATVAFSSVAGRFGNNGQSDYSAANDLLCKLTSSMAAWRPDTRAIAIDWTAWGGIGMASRGSVPQIMDALGVDMLAPEAGVPTIRRELTYGATRGEVLVAGRLGPWGEELDPHGGLDPGKAAQAMQKLDPPRLMTGKLAAAKLFGGLEIETLLDPNQQPFLYDHAPDPGAPWLPGVMATEAFAQAASLLAPGYHVSAVENMQMLSAFKFHRMEPRTLHISAEISPDAGGDLIAHAVLRSVTEPTKPGLPIRVAEHFRADVRLRRDPASAQPFDFSAPDAGSLPIHAAEIYKSFFHGPAYQVIEAAQVQGRTAAALMAHDLPPNTSPANAASLMAPRLIELCFQAVALWSLKSAGSMALPSAIERVTTYRQPEEAEGRRLYALAQARDEADLYDAQVVDDAGRVYVELHGFRTVARPVL